MQKNASLSGLFSLSHGAKYHGMYDAGRISKSVKERRIPSPNYQGRLSFHFFWKVNDRSCHSKAEKPLNNVL